MMTLTQTIHNKRDLVVEAGEIIVPKGDSIIPTKLKLLGAAEWSVVDATPTKEGGFKLLVTRPKKDS